MNKLGLSFPSCKLGGASTRLPRTPKRTRGAHRQEGVWEVKTRSSRCLAHGSARLGPAFKRKYLEDCFPSLERTFPPNEAGGGCPTHHGELQQKYRRRLPACHKWCVYRALCSGRIKRNLGLVALKCLKTHGPPNRRSAVQPRCPGARKLSSQLVIKIVRNKGQPLPSSQGGRWDFPGAHIPRCSP